MERTLGGRIGIIGLGLMGGAFAERLLDAGFEVFGWDIAGLMYALGMIIVWWVPDTGGKQLED